VNGTATTALLVRTFHRLKREPFTTLFNLTQPIIWLLFYANLMRHASFGSTKVVHYPTFMLSGIIAFTVFSNSLGGGIPLLFDKENGFLARLLATPIPRSSIVLSRFIHILIVSLAQVLLIVLLSAVFLGTHIETGFTGLVMILLVSTLLGFGLTALSLSLVFTLQGHAPFFALIGFVSLPALFLSPALVPLEVMPGWMRAAAWFNPMTHAIQAMRTFMAEDQNTSAVVMPLVILAIMDLACLALSLRVMKRSLVD
jgi:ABC-2 type transport system permease protein